MLLTKLHIPTSGKHLVHRTSLFSRLNEGFNRKLVLISAPAGFGKSTAVSDWIDKEKVQASWFSIDNYDNDVVTFLSYTIAALQGLSKEIGNGAMELLNSPNPPRPEIVINLLINDVVANKKESVLVFDDFHLISNTEILTAFAYFLDYLPTNLHLVIISRSDPTLPIAKLRSQQQVVELRSSDLSFSVNDIATLFNKNLKIKLSENDIRSLEEKTEGWIAGLQLAALSMQGQEDNSAFVNALAGNNRYIMDYLIEEVLKVQTDVVKEFLLKTSILEQYSGSLCNALLNTNNAQEVIEALETSNMFVIPLDAERKWYRYHHLFADLLKQRLKQDYGSEIESLHLKACKWFEENEMFDLAIEHAIQINDYEKCVQLLGNIAEDLWAKGNHEAIEKYGAIIPDELIKSNPNFSLYYAWILITGGAITKAEPLLLSALDCVKTSMVQSNTESGKNKFLLGKISVALAYLYSFDENSDKSFGFCDTAMNYLPNNDAFWLSWVWFSYGVTYYSKGLMPASVEAFKKAYEYGTQTNNIYLLSTIVSRMSESEQVLGNYRAVYERCAQLIKLISDKGYADVAKTDNHYAALYFNMGVVQFSWADFENAFENIKIAYELSKGVKDIYIRVFSLMVYTFLLKEMNSPEAKDIILELDEFISGNEVPLFLLAMYRGWRLYLLMEKNELDKAMQLANEYEISETGDITHINEGMYVSYSRLLLLRNDLEKAESLLTKLLKMVTDGGRKERIIEVKILFAALYRIRNERNKAIISVTEAMEMAQDQNLISYFSFNVNQIEDIIDEIFKIHATQKTNLSDAFINNLKTALKKKTLLKGTSVNIDLSSREIDTLKAMAEELSNQQIADKLFISLNTVKTHLKNIYLKLEVDNRKKAIDKAKELNLV